MGLLDDAIKEHLDLKRRRGADPAEVERDEREALGPVRRNQAPVAPDAAQESSDPDDGLAYDQAEDDDWSFDEADEPLVPAPGTAGRGDRTDYLDDELEDELEPLPPEPRSAEDEELGGATVEYDVQRDLQRELQHEAGSPTGETDEDEDVLEETPEFLQDTPDHDRLWFEQRPPRDFDFDG